MFLTKMMERESWDDEEIIWAEQMQKLQGDRRV